MGLDWSYSWLFATAVVSAITVTLYKHFTGPKKESTKRREWMRGLKTGALNKMNALYKIYKNKPVQSHNDRINKAS